MTELFLEVTFSGGRALAAYIPLPVKRRGKAYRTAPQGVGLLVDYNRRGDPIGIEITAPSKVSLAAINRILRAAGFGAMKRSELAPLRAA